MFDLFGAGPPEDWEPIPDEVLAELAPLDEIDPPPPGMVPVAAGADDFVWEAIGRTLGTETLPLLLATPLDQLSDQALSLALRRAEELSAHLDAFKAQLTAVIAGPTPTADPGRAGGEFAAEEIGVASKCSSYAADARIRFARELAGRLSATAAAMRDGQITAAQARYLVEQTHQLPVEVAREIEAGVLKCAWRQDLTAFKAAVRRWRSTKDPQFVKKAKAERAETIVAHDAGPYGTGELFIRGPLEITTQISMILTNYAAKAKAELGGSAADRKLAGLRDLAEAYLGSGHAPRQHRRLPIVNICIDLATLLGLRDGIAEIPGTLVQRPRRLAPSPRFASAWAHAAAGAPPTTRQTQPPMPRTTSAT